MLLRQLCIPALIPLMISCQTNNDKGSVLAQAYSNKLHLSDLSEVLEVAESSLDSNRIINKKVDEWLMQEILYKEAKSKLKVDEDLEALADAYKKELYIHKLESAMKKEQLSSPPTQAEIEDFIVAHELRSTIDEPLLKLLMVVVSKRLDSQKLQTLWKTEDLPGLKYYITKWDGFALLDLDKWHRLSDLNALLPDSLSKVIKFNSEKTYTVKHGEDIIYYKTLDYLSKGDSIPQSILEESARNKLSRIKFKDFLNTWKTELYKNKILSKDIQTMTYQG